MSFEVLIRRRLGDAVLAVDFASDAPLTALIGPSGAGKTSALNMIAGLLKPDSGRIAVAGETLFDAALGIDLSPERRRAGYVFQEGRLFPHRTVYANLLYGARQSSSEDRWLSLDDALAFLDIAHLLDRWPRSLSGGEARRVAIGRALLSSPRFLLLDEPLTSLDPARCEEIIAVIEQIRDELKLPILYVSHDQQEVARLAGRTVQIAPVTPRRAG